MKEGLRDEFMRALGIGPDRHWAADPIRLYWRTAAKSSRRAAPPRVRIKF
jgi:hypothetical protein